jgi:flagellar biosynthesis/type III secretory pathway protein FliH
MPEGFRSFASILTENDAAVLPAGGEPEPAPPPVEAVAADERVLDLLDGFVADLARLRARAAERLEEAIDAVVDDVARRLLARELDAAPAAIESLVELALLEFESGTRVTVRVSAHDAPRFSERTEVEIDAALGPGDFALELDDGRYDAALQTRLDALLASHRAEL